MNLDHLTPEERGTYYLLQQRWKRETSRKHTLYLLVLLAITLLVMFYGN